MKVSNRTSRRKKQKIRENPEFHLPQSSLKTMINIIIGYTKMRGPATNKQIMELTGERINAVSLAQGFLVDLGIIEGDIQKSSTLLGRELGRSLINGAESDIKMNLMKVVEKSSFCLNLLDDINQNGKVTRGIFQNRIFYYAKYLDPGKDIRIGANTLINILVRSGYVTKSGNYYKVSGAYEEFKKKLFSVKEF